MKVIALGRVGGLFALIAPYAFYTPSELLFFFFTFPFLLPLILLSSIKGKKDSIYRGLDFGGLPGGFLIYPPDPPEKGPGLLMMIGPWPEVFRGGREF
jgi:hypothetical protein